MPRLGEAGGEHGAAAAAEDEPEGAEGLGGELVHDRCPLDCTSCRISSRDSRRVNGNSHALGARAGARSGRGSGSGRRRPAARRARGRGGGAKRRGSARASSARASGAPTQKWMPAPKERCGAGAAGGVEAGRVGEARRVAVGGGEEAAHGVAGAEAVAEDLDVLERVAGEEVERRVEAQDFLDGGGGRFGGRRRARAGSRPEARIAATPLPMACTVASWPALSSSTQVAIELLGVEAVAFGLGGDQRGDEVVGGAGAAGGDVAARGRRRSRGRRRWRRPRRRGRGGPGTWRPWRATRRGARAPSPRGRRGGGR